MNFRTIGFIILLPTKKFPEPVCSMSMSLSPTWSEGMKRFRYAAWQTAVAVQWTCVVKPDVLNSRLQPVQSIGTGVLNAKQGK